MDRDIYSKIITKLKQMGEMGTDKVGDLSDLNTTAKTDVVSAINEVLNDIGDLSSLETTADSDVVSAINELVSAISTLGTALAGKSTVTIDSVTATATIASGATGYPTVSTTKEGYTAIGIVGFDSGSPYYQVSAAYINANNGNASFTVKNTADAEANVSVATKVLYLKN